MKITAALSGRGGDAPQLVELEQEAPRAGEMRIRLVATGICHTDLHEHPGRHSPQPIVLGHEGAGVVEELGEGVTGFAVGDHVILSGNSCGQCPAASPVVRPIATLPCRSASAASGWMAPPRFVQATRRYIRTSSASPASPPIRSCPSARR